MLESDFEVRTTLRYSALKSTLYCENIMSNETLCNHYHLHNFHPTIRLIKTRGPNNRNVTRDVFSCELGGFDQHFDLKASLGELYDQINQPLAGFR